MSGPSKSKFLASPLARKDLHKVFIDLKKTYDRVPREVMWWVVEKKCVPLKYIKFIKDIYDGAITNVRKSGDITSEFSHITGFY